jgi:hypothetical protein
MIWNPHCWVSKKLSELASVVMLDMPHIRRRGGSIVVLGKMKEDKRGRRGLVILVVVFEAWLPSEAQFGGEALEEKKGNGVHLLDVGEEDVWLGANGGSEVCWALQVFSTRELQES